jgi:hypothetical protein
LAQIGHCLYISLKAVCFCSMSIKIEDATEKFKTISSSSTNYDLSNPTTYNIAKLKL